MRRVTSPSTVTETVLTLRVPDGLVPRAPPAAGQPARALFRRVHHELLGEAADEALALLGPGLRSFRLVDVQVVSDIIVDALRVIPQGGLRPLLRFIGLREKLS